MVTTRHYVSGAVIKNSIALLFTLLIIEGLFGANLSLHTYKFIVLFWLCVDFGRSVLNGNDAEQLADAVGWCLICLFLSVIQAV